MVRSMHARAGNSAEVRLPAFPALSFSEFEEC
jgi:hypothetical protein